MSQPSTLSYRMKSSIASTAKGGRNTGRLRYEMPRPQCWPELQAALTSAALRLQSIICEVSLGSFSGRRTVPSLARADTSDSVGFLKRPSEAEELCHARLIKSPGPPAALSEDNNEKSVTNAAKTHALKGRHVFTGTPSSMVIGILPRVARPRGERRGPRCVPLI